MRDIAKVLMGEEFTQTERLYLVSLGHHEGFPVLKKMIDQVCRLAHEDSVTLDPEDSQYERKLAARVQRERNFNEFAEAIRKSFLANVMIANDEEKKANERDTSATN